MKMKDDPYNDIKKIHYANLIGPQGQVSPMCANPPRAINLNREIWTLRKQDVTCSKCLDALGVPDAKREAKRRRDKQIEFIVGKD
jgi:hypothetical protein